MGIRVVVSPAIGEVRGENMQCPDGGGPDIASIEAHSMTLDAWLLFIADYLTRVPETG